MTYAHSVGPLWTSDWPLAEATTWQPDNTQHLQQTDIHAPGMIRTRNYSKRATANYALDRAATAIINNSA